MLFLGLLLLACTAAFTGLVLSDNLSGGPDYRVTVLGEHIATMNVLAIFCAGLALALIFGLGCLMALAGGGMRRRKHRKLRSARRETADTARERDTLAKRLDNRGPEPGPAAYEKGHQQGYGEGYDKGYGQGSADPGPESGRPTSADAAAGSASGDRGPGASRVETPPRTKHRRSGLHLFGH